MNEVSIAGKVKEFDGRVGKIEVERTSGVVDIIPFEAPGFTVPPVGNVSIRGSLKTRNVKSKEDGKSHKKMFVSVSSMDSACWISRNEIEFEGILVSKGEHRRTPLGKTIIDLVLAINEDGKSYYPSVIAWGSVAAMADSLDLGTGLKLVGRFQSRGYQKKYEDGTVEDKIAYEISASSLEVL